MTAAVSTDWAYRGLQALSLRNEHLTVHVLPELGGKVWEVHDRTSGRQLLWHHPRLRVRPVPFGSTYDDVFHGGWDELFPNDVPEVLAGEQYPDHGELWSLPWDWRVVDDDGGAAVVRLALQTPVSACSLEKTLTLEPGARSLRVDLVLRNDSDTDLPFLWKQHLALAVDEPARVDLPARDVLLDAFSTPRAGTPGTAYTWPAVQDGGGSHDLRPTLPRTSRVVEFHQALALDDGWCALTYDDGTGVGLSFDSEVFRSCWVFSSFGGWRDLQVTVLEPCTGYPLSVAEGAAAGTHQVLRGGQRIATTVRLVVFDGMREVTGISPDGVVSGEPR